MFIVDSHNNNTRLDVFLATVGAYKSRSLAAKFCDAGKVMVNGKVAQKKLKVFENDQVCYEPAVENNDLKAEDIPLDIRYEDNDILVISKQPGLVCHPAPGNETGTLVNALINHCGVENLYKGDDPMRLGIVHRLDGDTSGLMIVAKSQEAGQALVSQMKAYSTSRHYKTLVYGIIKHDTGKIDVPLLRSLNNRPKMKASNDANAKNAVTSFEVLERIDCDLGKFTLLDCKIHTGRTHQIRAHMEYINHCVVGDPLYNSGAPKGFDAKKELGLSRQFLHSYKIAFDHPITGKKLQFEDNLPPGLIFTLNRLI